MLFPIKFTKFTEVNLYVCMLFVIPLEKFHRYGDINITGVAWLLHPSGIGGSFECHTYCDTGHQFLWISPRTCVSHTYYRALGSGAIPTCFNDLRLSWLGFKHPIFRLRDKCSNQLRHCNSQFFVLKSSSN